MVAKCLRCRSGIAAALVPYWILTQVTLSHVNRTHIADFSYLKRMHFENYNAKKAKCMRYRALKKSICLCDTAVSIASLVAVIYVRFGGENNAKHVQNCDLNAK